MEYLIDLLFSFVMTITRYAYFRRSTLEIESIVAPLVKNWVSFGRRKLEICFMFSTYGSIVITVYFSNGRLVDRRSMVLILLMVYDVVCWIDWDGIFTFMTSLVVSSTIIVVSLGWGAMLSVITVDYWTEAVGYLGVNTGSFTSSLIIICCYSIGLVIITSCGIWTLTGCSFTTATVSLTVTTGSSTLLNLTLMRKTLRAKGS